MNRISKELTSKNNNGVARAMLYATGMNKEQLDYPQIGIGSMWFDSNPCNCHLDELSNYIKTSLKKQKLQGMRFNTIGVSDGITMGTFGMSYSLPSREIIADSVEMITSAHMYDGLVTIPGCDKNIPASLMAMGRINRPGLMVYGGTMKPGLFNGKEVDIVSGFQSYGQVISGEITTDEREDLLSKCCPSPGSCGGMYTANTMAVLSEAMGLTLPYSSSNPAMSTEKYTECSMVGNVVYNLLKKDIKPRDIVKEESIYNGLKLANILGGSTNIVLHILAISKDFGYNMSINDYKYICKDVPLLGNLKPFGKYLMNDIHELGGTPRIIKYLISENILNGDMLTVTGKTLWENVENTEPLDFEQDIIRPLDNPLKRDSHIRILHGNLAPLGAVAKITGKEGIKFTGKACVYNDEKSFLKDLKQKRIHKGSVIVIRYMGPKGGPGMPEMLKATSAIVGSGLENDIAFITDGRFSGGSHGFIIGHITPEAYDNGPIAYIKNGDKITIDAKNDIISLEKYHSSNKNYKKIPLEVLERDNKIDSTLSKYRKLVSCASKGAITN